MPRKSEQIPREEKKKEALRLMQIMGFDKTMITKLKDEDAITLTSITPDPKTDDLHNKKLLSLLNNLMEETHAYVYAITRNHTDCGVIDSALFISDHKEDWEYERRNAKNMAPMAFCFNHTFPQFSEPGSVSIFLDSSGTPLRRF